MSVAQRSSCATEECAPQASPINCAQVVVQILRSSMVALRHGSLRGFQSWWDRRFKFRSCGPRVCQ
ncbi:MAG: hypothetical protein EBY29_16530, partial [Planctomycetes bacterium]|nr:hypothetical protein [Planctomycetota bacterium]